MASSSTSKEIREPTLVVNNFNLPDEKSNVDEWIELIRSIIFLEKGTYSDEPNCGVDITTYEFRDLINGCDTLQSEIEYQCKAYLPDIPIGALNVTAEYLPENNVYVVKVSVYFKNDAISEGRTLQLTDEDGVISAIINKFNEK